MKSKSLKTWRTGYIGNIILRLFLISIFTFSFNCQLMASLPQDQEEDHKALSELLVKIVTLVNNDQVEEVENYLDKSNFTMITGDGNIFIKVEDLKKYWQGLTKPGTHIKKIIINPKPASYTNFLSPEIGIAIGTSLDEYEFSNGAKKNMKMYWTVVVHKVNGQWRISTIHYSASITDNLVLEYQKRSLLGKLFW